MSYYWTTKENDEMLTKLLNNLFFKSHFQYYYRHGDLVDWTPNEKDLKWLIDLVQSKIDKIPTARTDAKYAKIADEIEAYEPYLKAIKEGFESVLKEISTASYPKYQDFENEFFNFIKERVENYDYEGREGMLRHVDDAVVDYFVATASDYL